MPNSFQSRIKPGLIALHGNQVERVVDTFLEWMRSNPLAPLEEELILTPTYAMAEWVKLRLAKQQGICCAVTVNLPGKVIWSLYRSILNELDVPPYSATDREVLVWRLMRILPKEMGKDSYALINQYLSQFGDDVLFKLATQLADLFDQYQVYRADWLKSWEEGGSELVGPKGELTSLLPQEIWQSECWRAVVQDLNEQEKIGIRPHLHDKVMRSLESGEFDASLLPQRITLLGVGSLPMQNLAFFAALSKYTQICIGVNSPCQYHWADIIEGREFFKFQRRRLKQRGHIELSTVDFSKMHLHANPLLSAWGRQNRDFVRQLDEFDDVQMTMESFKQLKLDVFSDRQLEDPTSNALEGVCVLHQIQDQIRDLDPIKELDVQEKQAFLLATQEFKLEATPTLHLGNSSLVFQMCHGLTRELEVLHDQLLHLFEATRWREGSQPYDVLVLMPSIEDAMPAIDAVFGQYDRSDARYIPYSIADQKTHENHPLVDSLKWLTQIGSSRFYLSDLLSILKTPCIAHKFGLKENDFEQLEYWLKASGMRWGLHQEQRESLGFAVVQDLNTIVFGIRRMLLGYTNASDEIVEVESPNILISPLPMVSGMDAEIVGSFVSFVEVVCEWWQESQGLKSPEHWIQALTELMNQLIKLDALDDMKIYQALTQALNQFQEVTRFASFDGDLSVKVAGSVWLDALKTHDKRQRVLSNGVTFGSIKTLSGLPFNVICLLGMNDGEFPRLGVHNPFDLMEKKGQVRVGDRSKSHDDRALMLQALLCAREKLYISWSAFSDRDNSLRSPSVLVTQLRQYVQDKWSVDFLNRITSRHPMQPFSLDYFTKASKLQTYAKEWYPIHLKHGLVDEKSPSVAFKRSAQPLSSDPRETEFMRASYFGVENQLVDQMPRQVCTINEVVRTFKNPIKEYFRRELSIDFPILKEDQIDIETFGLDALEVFQLKDRILNELVDFEGSEHLLQKKISCLLKKSQVAAEMPLGPMGVLLEKSLLSELFPQLKMAAQLKQLYPKVLPVQVIECMFGAYSLHDELNNLRSQSDDSAASKRVHLEVLASRLFKKDQMRAHHLLRPWLMSVILKHLELNVQMVILFTDVHFLVTEPSKELSELTIRTLGQVFTNARESFLPMPLKTAMQYAKSKDLQKARSIYEGGDHSVGEVSDMSLERLYPEFDLMIQDPDQLDLWLETYEPFWQWYEIQNKPQPYDQMSPLLSQDGEAQS